MEWIQYYYYCCYYSFGTVSLFLFRGIKIKYRIHFISLLCCMHHVFVFLFLHSHTLSYSTLLTTVHRICV